MDWLPFGVGFHAESPRIELRFAEEEISRLLGARQSIASSENGRDIYDATRERKAF
jgi:hypothetical protein